MVTHNAAALRRFDPFFVGFDRLWQEIDRLDRTDAFVKPQSYPPYNIRKHEDDETYSIELAVAGFKEQDINVVLEDSKLTVQGEIKETDGGNLLHKGIALRAFTRHFTLSDTIEVEGAELKDGMLIIMLKNIIPDHKKPRQIPVTPGGKLVEAKKELLVEQQ